MGCGPGPVNEDAGGRGPLDPLGAPSTGRWGHDTLQMMPHYDDQWRETPGPNCFTTGEAAGTRNPARAEQYDPRFNAIIYAGLPEARWREKAAEVVARSEMTEMRGRTRNVDRT